MLLAFSSNGKQLATAGADETVRLIDFATGHEMWEPRTSERFMPSRSATTDGM